jgi:hypothetical protein
VYGGKVNPVDVAVQVPLLADSPQAQQHNGSGAEPAGAGADIRDAKVLLLLTQPYAEIEMAL